METITLALRVKSLLQERFPGNYTYTPLLADILGVHEKTVLSKLRGDTQFTLMEIYTLGKKLDIPVGEIFNEPARKDKHPLEIYIHEFENLSRNPQTTHQTLEAFRMASSSVNSTYYVASNTLPDLVFSDHPWIAKLYFIKWIYFSKGHEQALSLGEVEFDESHYTFYRQYRDYINSFKFTLYVLYMDIARTVAEDILFFYKNRLVTKEEAGLIIDDLSKLIDMCEGICKKGGQLPNPIHRNVHFFFSKVLLPNDVTILESDEMNLAILYANYHNPIVTISSKTFAIFRQWFHKWMHSSNIISASDPEQRYEFFQRQRDQLMVVRNNIQR